ncbi:MAG: plasmid maintenance system killer, partial [Hoeflea sp.]|nr:plasmid maintenance system killer [Hoeflea sp.]
MIKSFRNKQLASLWETSRSKIDKRLHRRILARLDKLNDAETIDDLNVTGFDFHALKGLKPT